MLKTAVIGKTANGATHVSRIMVMSGDRIVLVDAVTGQPPKKVIIKMVNKDLHIFAEGAFEPSVILNDYASFSQSVDISGIDSSGSYVNYGTSQAGSMELGAVTPITSTPAPIMSTSAWWGVGILAVAGGVAAAAGGGGGGDSSTPIVPTPSDTTAPAAPVIAAVATDDIVNLAENASLVISGTGEIGATVTLAVTGQTAVVNSSGNWSITVVDAAASFAEGAETLSVTQTDVAGNTSVAATRAITVETIAPTLTITNNQGSITANMDGSNADGTLDADGADILYTFTFDEAVNDFTVTDISIPASEGTAKTFTKISDTQYTLGVTPLAGYEGNMTVGVVTSTYHDVVGNTGNVASDTLSEHFVDMLAPVLNDTLFDGTNDWSYDYTNKSITFTLNSPLEAVNMTNPDNFIVELNTKAVAVSAVAMLGNTVTLIMAESFEATESVRVVYKDATTDLSAAIQDLAGNDATSFTYLKSDVTPPTITQIFFNNPNLSIGQSSLVTINFSEEVKDLVVGFENGTLSGLAPTADASIWTATFTANANVELTSNSFSVGIGAYHDLNNLANVAATEYTYFVDTRAPSISIADDEEAAVANIAGGNITYTFIFSESVTGFTLQDITIIGGNPVGALSGSGAVYTLAIAPTAGVVGNVTIDVAANRVTDLLGNPNTIADQSIQAVDIKAPTVIISMDDAIVTSGDTPTVNFTFSEAVFGFDLADLDLTNANGILNNLSSADGGVTYSGLLIPTAGMPEDLSNIITLDGVYTDAAGNAGTLGASGNYIVDTKAPLYVSAAANNANDTIIITFDDVLDAANHAVGTDFYVTDGSLTADLTDGNAVNKIDVLGVAVSGVTMTLSMKPMEAGIWKVIYTDTVGNTQYAIQDVYGSDTTGFSWTASVI